MNAEQLRRWLVPSLDERPGDAELQLLAGETPLSPPMLESLSFAVAVLRDVYTTDDELRAWLARPQPRDGGDSPIDLVRRGDARALETAAVRQWNRQTSTPPYRSQHPILFHTALR